LYRFVVATAQGRVVALDVSAGRLQALRNAAEAQGLGAIVTTRAADLRQEAAAARAAADGGAAAASFDRVLLDAPCSGACQRERVCV
jgi:16S rRNA (cytosine967-C5)-methyltransferase